jgi:hypothetical protein
MQYDYHIGDYEVEVDNDALKAQVKYIPTGQILKRFTGEFAWADARRFADDRHVMWKALLKKERPQRTRR